MIPNRMPGTAWLLRRMTSSTNGKPNGLVATVGDDLIRLAYWHDGAQRQLILPRRDARLMAKRINECLDATTKR